MIGFFGVYTSSECYLCWNESHPSAVLCGSTIKTAALLDVEKDKILYQCDTQTIAPLNGLLFAIDSYKFITLTNSGSIELWDPRMKALAVHCDNIITNHGISDTRNYAIDVCGSSYEGAKLTCVSRQEKQVVFYELRQWKKPYASILLDHGPQTSSNKQPKLCVKV